MNTNDTLHTDFAGFVEARLDLCDKSIRGTPEYLALQNKVDGLKTAVSRKFDSDLDALDDGFYELSTLYQKAAYQLGFKDGVTFMADSW